MLGAGTSNADDIGLLKSIVSNEKGRDLTGKDEDGDGIHIGSGNSGDRIRGPWPGGHHGHPYFPCSPCISVCGMDSSLLMTNQYLPEGGIDKLIKKGKNGTPRIIEEGIDSFLLQAFNNDLRTGFLHDESMSNVKAQSSNEIQMT
jgi:hypothetical protein